MSPSCNAGGVDEADDVAGERLVDRLAVGPNAVVAYLVANGPAGALAGHDHAPLEAAGADAGEGDAVAVRRVHVGLDLEHERRERRVERARLAVDRRAAATARGEVDDGVEQHAHAEVGQRRPDEHRRRLAGEERRQVDVGADRVEQVALVERGLSTPSCPPPPPRDVDVDRLLGAADRAAGGAGEPGELAGAAVDHAAEVAARSPTGHVTGVGRSPICSSISSSSSSGSRPGRSYLLRNVITGRLRARHTWNSFSVWRLDALGRVEHHHHGVDGGQHAVGVLGEVAVARRVEQVDDVVAVGELHHRRADRDAALLLHLHPVADVADRRPSRAVTAPADLHRAGVEQELLRQRRLAGVGVADDRKGATALPASAISFMAVRGYRRPERAGHAMLRQAARRCGAVVAGDR